MEKKSRWLYAEFKRFLYSFLSGFYFNCVKGAGNRAVSAAGAHCIRHEEGNIGGIFLDHDLFFTCRRSHASAADLAAFSRIALCEINYSPLFIHYPQTPLTRIIHEQSSFAL
jgi:hypothetical protein